jgi:hypothetical protein
VNLLNNYYPLTEIELLNNLSNFHAISYHFKLTVPGFSDDAGKYFFSTLDSVVAGCDYVAPFKKRVFYHEKVLAKIFPYQLTSQ